MVSFFAFVSMYGLRPFVPILAQEVLRASLFEVGLVASSFALIGILLSVPFGFVSDKFGRRILIVTGATIFGVFTLMIPRVSSPIELLLVYAIAGLGISLLDPLASAAVGDVSDSGNLGRSYGVFTMTVHAALIIGPLIGGVLALLYGLRSVFIFGGAVSLLAASISVMIYPRKRMRISTRLNFREQLNELSHSRPVLTGWLTTLVVFTLIGGLSAFLPLYVLGIGLNAAFVGILFAVQSIVNGLSRIPVGILTDKMGRHNIVLIPAIIEASLITFFLVTVAQPMMLIGLIAILGLGLGPSVLVGMVLVASGSTAQNRGVAMGFLSMFKFAGFALGPILVGYLISAFSESSMSFQIGFAALTVVGLSGGFIIFILGRGY